MGGYNIFQRYIIEHEIPRVLAKSHEGITGGRYGGKPTMQKVLHAGLWCSTIQRDLKEY
jgi:hypothetical protein